ncbi:MAG: GAF domain-containing protein [Arthrobacter sp.]
MKSTWAYPIPPAGAQCEAAEEQKTWNSLIPAVRFGRRTGNAPPAPPAGPVSVALEADAAQYGLGEGPCLSAWATERTVVVSHVATDDRWPLWSQALGNLAVRAAISTPLMAGRRCLGALKIYSTQPGAYGVASARPP